MQLRDHTFLGLTHSLCPECLAVVPAKIVADRRGRVYFRKRCPEHGERLDFVCSDVRQYDRMEFSVPGKLPEQFGVDPQRGCPLDCGLCSEHEQHTCVGLVEITSSCNLTCPMCYAASAPGGHHLSLAECCRAIDRLVAVEGRPEVLQLSGGEPTIHPEFGAILEYAVRQPIDVVMVNTNGLRLAQDEALAERLAEFRRRIEIYLQFDGLDDEAYRPLRGEALAGVKHRAVEMLGKYGLRTTLVTTVQPGVNEHQLGAIIDYALARPWITGVSLQPATYSGRHVLPADLEGRTTFPDVIRLIAQQTSGRFAPTDFLPLPCAHPNCHSLAYAYRTGTTAVPLTRFINAAEHLDLLANGITFTRPLARKLIESYLGRLGCCSSGNCEPPAGQGSLSVSKAAGIAAPDAFVLPILPAVAELSATPGLGVDLPTVAGEFFRRALTEELHPEDVLRITITSFLDAYNFDVRRLMKCCIHHVLPSGHVIPFCAYNVLYRNGHVPLPALVSSISRQPAR